MDSRELGRFIQCRRKDLGMTQAELGAKTNVTDKAISRWKLDVGFPDIKLLEPLAGALHISLPELIQSRQIDASSVYAEASPVFKAHRKSLRTLSILCFIIYSLLSLVLIHYAPTDQLSWLAPMEKMLFLLTAATFIYASHKEYKAMWISVPTAAAFFLKILRSLGYRFFISFILSSGENDAIFSRFHKSSVVFGMMDTVVFLLLLISLIRIILLGSFWRWYSKTINSAAKGDTP